MADSAQKLLDEVSESLASGDKLVVVIVRDDEPVTEGLEGLLRYDVRWSEDLQMFDLMGAAGALEETVNNVEPG